MRDRGIAAPSSLYLGALVVHADGLKVLESIEMGGYAPNLHVRQIVHRASI